MGLLFYVSKEAYFRIGNSESCCAEFCAKFTMNKEQRDYDNLRGNLVRIIRMFGYAFFGVCKHNLRFEAESRCTVCVEDLSRDSANNAPKIL